LLRQLGVTRNSFSSSLSSTAFTEHCRKFLLVSSGALAQKTDGDECYFIPTTCEYPIATEGSDWAVGTMWTRCDVWQTYGYIEIDAPSKKQRRFKFCSDYVARMKERSDGCLLPALPLAIFLLRDPLRTGISLDEVRSEKDLVDLFLRGFNIADSEAIDLFDLTVEKVPGHGG
jgi:hypothetical protein